MIKTKNQTKVREEIFALLKQVLSEATGNPWDEIREEAQIYSELNLTEFDLQRIIKEVGTKIEIDTQVVSESVEGNEEIVTVGDVLNLLVDEKELG
jgi:hypothetical protein